MKGILDDTPTGVLDPRSMALMQMGMGLMASSGPSLTPTSFGQNLGQAGMQGMQAFQQAQQMNQQQALRQLQARQIEEQMRLEQEKANRPPALMSGGPGTVFFDPATKQPIFTVPSPKADEPKVPMTRRYRVGDQEVTEEYVNGAWRELGRGNVFAPKGSGTQAAALPKPPTGYRYRDGTDELEAIPGGPKDTSPKDAARAAGAVQKADTVIRKVDEALGQTGMFSTGLPGAVAGMIPGTPAYNLDKTLDTIKANLGFSELQAMREASPTGGALGQVAIQELAMLQSTVASLDKGQSREQLERGLTQVKTHFENWKSAVQQAQQQKPSAPAAPSLPQKGQVVDGWEFLGGDPGNRMNWRKK